MSLDIVVKGIDQASSVLDKISGAVGGLAGLAGGALTAGLGAATAGFAALGAGLAYGVAQAIDAEKAMAQTEAVIKSTGGAAGLTAQAVADLASELSKQSTYADDAIQSAENLLLTFTNIGKDVFPLATQSMVDMAAAMGTDVKSGAIQLGKALNDPIAGISALSRVGVTFTEEQKKVIEQLVKTGDVAGAQKVILEELNKEFGGSAAAAANTFGGKLQQLQNRLDGVAETVGGALLPVLGNLLTKYIDPLIPAIEILADVLADAIGGDVGLAFDDLREGFGKSFAALVPLVDALIGVPDVVSAAIGEFDRFKKMLEGNVPISGILKKAFGDMIPPELRIELAGMLDPLRDALVDLPDRLSGFMNILAQGAPLSLALRYALEGLIPTSLLDALDDLQSAFSTHTELIKRAVEGLTVFVLEQFTIMGGTLSENTATALSAISDLWKKYGDDIILVVTGLVGIIITTFAGALTLLSGIIAAALQILNGDWDGAWKTMGDTLTTFLNQALALVNTNLAAVQASWEGTLNLMLTAVAAIFENILSTVRETIKGFVSTIRGGVTDALNTITGMVSKFSDAGKGIINAMIDGVVSAAGGLAAAAVSAVQSALAAASGAASGGGGSTGGGNTGGGGGGSGSGSGGGGSTHNTNTLIINTPVAPSVPHEFSQAAANAGAQ